MTTIEKARHGVRFIMYGVILGLIALAMPALAASGTVLPPTAEPHGYSLTEIAGATAVFNTSGPGGRSEATEPPVPFQILYTSTTNPSNTFDDVPSGTMLYVPVVFADNSPPILGDFPDVNDPEAVSDYYFNPEQLGAEFIEIEVDGKVTSLGPAYVVGVAIQLPNTATGYTVAAVFLTPLSPGTHTVIIRARFTGDALAPIGGVFEAADTYTVVVD